jgi:hypothetical protein
MNVMVELRSHKWQIFIFFLWPMYRQDVIDFTSDRSAVRRFDLLDDIAAAVNVFFQDVRKSGTLPLIRNRSRIFSGDAISFVVAETDETLRYRHPVQLLSLGT